MSADSSRSKMDKKTIRNVDLSGKRVLMRVDFNVPIEAAAITDDSRITAALPTIRYALDEGAKLVLVSHLGRPNGKPSAEFSLKPIAEHLSGLLDKPVTFIPDCVGPAVVEAVSHLQPGAVLLLENVRFHPEEELLDKYAKQDDATKKRIDAFVRDLSSLGDLYVNDAFGTAHRAHASTQGVTKYFPDLSVAGLLMEREISVLGGLLDAPARPFVAILGGAKVSDKIDVITNLLGKVDKLLIGGAMAYTFLRAQGVETGTSKVEDDKIDLAKEILRDAAARNVEILLPIDHVQVAAFSAEKAELVAPHIRPDLMALDIGPETTARYVAALKDAKTVLWNGPMGVFERDAFAVGTFSIARALAESNAVTVIGGGDSVSAARAAGVAEHISHISTGGGASLELLEGKILPGLAALSDTN